MKDLFSVIWAAVCAGVFCAFALVGLGFVLKQYYRIFMFGWGVI
jgi:hypothetical protein